MAWRIPRHNGARLALSLFFVSGAVSLLYETAWARLLAVHLGNDTVAAGIVLAVFMAGLAIGSLVVGWFGDRIRYPVLWYGACEVVMALSALAVPDVLRALEPVSRAAYELRDFFPAAYGLSRAGIAGLTFVVPTICMGASIPLVVRAFAHTSEDFGGIVARLYALNCLGAVAGVMVGAFVLLPRVGIMSTIRYAAALGIIAGLICVWIGRRMYVPPDPALSRPPRGRSAVAWSMALSGMGALALEVVWMRMLAQSMAATTYAFAIMLATFILSLFWGSRIAAPYVDRVVSPVRVLSALSIAIAGAISITIVAGYAVPATMHYSVEALAGTPHAFAFLTLVRFLVSFASIGGAALLLGATFPFAVRAYTLSIGERAATSAFVYAANTAGAAIGALVGAFLFLPILGISGSLVAIAGIFAANGAVLAVATSQATGRLRSAMAGTASVVAVMALVLITWPLPTTVRSLGQAIGGNAMLAIFSRNDPLSTVSVVRGERGTLHLAIDGAVVASAGADGAENAGMMHKAVLPLLLHAAPSRVLVIGLGTGVTGRAATAYPGVRTVDIVEISPAVVEAAHYFDEMTGGVVRDPGINLHVADARNFLRLTERRFDVITSDMVHPAIAGQGSLYTREYYELLRARLDDGAVVQQWIPLTGISERSFAVIVKTFASVFPHTSVYYAFGQVSLIGTTGPAPIDCVAMQEKLASPEMGKRFPFMRAWKHGEFFDMLLLGPEGVRAFVAGVPTSNTDDNAYLEYHVPFETARDDSAAILHSLASFSQASDAGIHQCAASGGA
jgi:spermidine synthase